MNYQKLCLQVCDIAREAGKFQKEQRGNINASKIESKGVHNFVTYVDKKSEEMIVSALSKLLPESGFIAEEGTSDKKEELYNWIIDPLDGTTNYIHGLSPWAVSIALQEGDDIVIGVVYEVSLNECFYAWKESPAFLNDLKIFVSEIDKVDSSLLATGFPYHDYSHIDNFMKTLDYFMRHSHGLRRLGSAATDLVYVACGRIEGFYEYGLNPWDVAAGAFIVERAGGVNADFQGTNNYIFGEEIISSNKNIFNELYNDAVNL